MKLGAVLTTPLAQLREGLDRWILARVPSQTGSIELKRDRIYIVPTRFGWGFALTGLVMLLGAMNYSNSMAYALCFLLGGLGLVSMHHTHANLVHLRLRPGRAEPVFAGSLAQLELIVDNPARLARYSLALGWPRQPGTRIADLPGGASTVLQLALPTHRRGWLPAGVISLSTEFPLGLFHAWTWARLELGVMVYPQPAPPGGPPPASAGRGGRVGSSNSGQDEFSGLRPYRPGDPLPAIHWKSLPRTGQPMVKVFSDNVEHSEWLDYDALSLPDPEQRLAQLARWVLDADGAGARYGLRLPGIRVAPDSGERHRHACLRALALFGGPGFGGPGFGGPGFGGPGFGGPGK